MGYQLKLEVLSKPKKKLSELEKRATEKAIEDCTIFLENTMRNAIKKHKKTGKTESSIRKLVFRLKLSSKVFFDINIAPHVAELMRGNKTPRTIEVKSAKALRFTIQGRTVFAKSVKRPRTFGLRIPEKMRFSPAVNTRLREIFLKHLNTVSGKTEVIITGPVELG